MIKTPLSTVIGGAFWTPSATIIGSSSKNLTQLIKSLFSLGEQGFAYDPNDLTTLYRDEAGTIPVTASEQPVGLMLDKSKQLKRSLNLVINPTFDTLNWWEKFGNPTVTPIATGEVKIVGDPGYAAGLSQVINTDGSWVCVKAKIKIERDISSDSSGLNLVVYPTEEYSDGIYISQSQIGEYIEHTIYVRSTSAAVKTTYL